MRLALLLAAALPAAALAQQTHATVPELDGHVFTPSYLVDTPFRQTTFKLGLLYGTGTATGPKYDFTTGGTNGTADYTFATMAQTFRYEYAFTEWLSAGALVLTSMYTGLDGPSAVAVGAQFGLGAGLRVKGGHRFGPIETAVQVDVSSGPEYGVLVAAALVRALQDHVIEPGTALQSTHAVTVNPSLAASWAPWPALGVTANVGYLFKSLRLSSQNITEQSGVQFGGVLDFDFGKISSVPVGVQAGYRHTSGVGSSELPPLDDASFGVNYTGIRELALGLEAGWRSFTLRPGTDVALDSSATVAQINLQYYW